MAITFGGAVGVKAPAVFDANTQAPGGAVSTGIGLLGADGVSVPGAAYMGPPTTPVPAIKFDTDRNAATP